MVHPGDSPPMSDKDRSSNRMERTKKKVEWSSNLSSVESFAPEDRSPNWDSETDHLLSYFLGGEHQNNGTTTSPLTQFATTPQPTVNGNPASILHGRQASNHPYVSGPRPGQHGFSGALGRPYGGNFDEDHAPPPTPATQYYHHSSKPKATGGRPPTHSSDPKAQPQHTGASSSISNMKASLVGGAFGGGHHSSSDQQLESMSPVSPAAMIGSGHEELMLPPSPQIGGRQQPRMTESPQQPRQSHLEWLQHINALAQQANATSSNTSGPVPTPVQTTSSHPTQSGSTPPPAAFPYHGVPGLPSMSAAYGHAPMYYAQAALNQLQQQQTPAPESEEKRAKRLERNRESARKSRRRKKERLSQLEEKVSGLHNQIESARTVQIQYMTPQLQNFFLRRIMKLDAESAYGDDVDKSELAAIFKGTGPNCEVQRAVIDFQYSKLKQTLLPRYQKFLLWLTLHPEDWFSAGKEDHVKREAAKQVARITSGKISSKQVGDELTNGSKLEDGTFVPPPQAPTPNSNGEKANQTAEAFDTLRMWPLLCFELSISVDQEERILRAYESAQKRQDLQHIRSQIEAATRMASRLKEAVLLQSHNVAVRGERTYLHIMTPNQSVAYKKWAANNRERCHGFVDRSKILSEKAPSPTVMDDSKISENLTLIEVCRKLEAVLKISKGETDGLKDMAE